MELYPDREAMLAAATETVANGDRVILIALTNYEGLTLRQELIARGVEKRAVHVVSAYSPRAIRGLSGRMLVDPELVQAIEAGKFPLVPWWERERHIVEASLASAR